MLVSNSSVLPDTRISGFVPASFRGSQVNAGVTLEPFRKAASSFPIILPEIYSVNLNP